MSFEIGGISVFLLLMGLVEFAKKVWLTGEKSTRIFAFVVGAMLFALWRSFPLLSEQAQIIAQIALWAITGPLAAMGLYDLQRAFRPIAPGEPVKLQDPAEFVKQSKAGQN